MSTASYLKRESKFAAGNDTMTPPMTSSCPRSRSSSVSSVSSFDSEAYFSKTYVPLSSLPTPPMSSHSNSFSQQLPEALFSTEQILDPELLGPAIHLTNLIPPSTSLTTASVSLVHAILTRADLPLETVALAVCILDSLNSRFALQWRKSCPLIKSLSKAEAEPVVDQHVDSIHPELLILSALILAVKFLDDAQQRTREYLEDWGRGLWTCEQVNYTQRCLLENLGYRLLPLWEHNIILGALEDMERAGRHYANTERVNDWDTEVGTCFTNFTNPDFGDGRGPNAGQGLGLDLGQLTPGEMPLVESVESTRRILSETRKAMQSLTLNELHLPCRSKVQQESDPFPAYIDSALRDLEERTT